MAGKNSGQAKNMRTVSSPNDLNAGQTVFSEVVWFLHALNEFPAHSMDFTYISVELYNELFDSEDWTIFYDTRYGRCDKKMFDDRYTDHGIDPFSREGHLSRKENMIALINEDVGLVLFKTYDREKGVFKSVDMLFRDTKEAKEFVRSLPHYLQEKVDDGKPIINVVKKDNDGYKTRDFEVEHHELDFHRHYEDSEKLESLHNKILDNINDNTKSQSFYVFHGDPGTGKTSYIKYLMTSIKKNVIYIPPHLIDMIADPHFVDFMADNANSVIVIEDAEDLVQQGQKRSNALSNLLNMTDGILGDCFKMDFICTFNTDIRKIDEALMRNGRLNGIFKFTELGYEKAKTLCDEQGMEVPEKGSRTLANIFGEEPEDIATEEDLLSYNTIGFNSNESDKELKKGITTTELTEKNANNNGEE